MTPYLLTLHPDPALVIAVSCDGCNFKALKTRCQQVFASFDIAPHNTPHLTSGFQVYTIAA
jgi:hypothetical protein